MNLCLPTKKLYLLALFLLISSYGFCNTLAEENFTISKSNILNDVSNELACMPVWVINELDADTADTR